jgi:hypothetical protein
VVVSSGPLSLVVPLPCAAAVASITSVGSIPVVLGDANVRQSHRRGERNGDDVPAAGAAAMFAAS